MLFQNTNIKNVKLELGSLVKLLRKQNKLSQQELADLLDISRITIQNLEQGKNFTIDTLLKILQHFDLLPLLHKEILQYKEQQSNIKSLY